MKYVIRIVLLLLVVAIVGGGGWLAVTEPEAPRQDLEKVIPNDRFDF